MPNWNQILSELQQNGKSPYDHLRHKYLKKMTDHTDRNVLVYYSGWLQKDGIRSNQFSINDSDKTGFMTCSSQLDRSKGLDLVLHTPGGDVAATESIIDYLHSLYDGNIRAIVPQLAMSGGTLMALSCKEIIMGRQSSLGPVDPQIGGMPAQGVIEEFNLAAQEITQHPSRIEIWKPIISKYWPTLITSCNHAIDWADLLMKQYLGNCMFHSDSPKVRSKKIKKIANTFGKQSTSKNHSRHINKDTSRSLGLKIVDLEADQELQDIVLSLHHANTITFTHTNAIKIIENQNGVAYVAQAS